MAAGLSSIDRRDSTVDRNDSLPRHFIREWRKHRGLTQEQLANAAAMDRTYLNKIERGIRLCGSQGLAAIASALDCPPGDLIGRHPDHSSELETFCMTLSAEERARALTVLRVIFER
jgi:transcriptional regulator with XRE-family HTH domain